jgi:hypothetical protein
MFLSAEYFSLNQSFEGIIRDIKQWTGSKEGYDDGYDVVEGEFSNEC